MHEHLSIDEIGVLARLQPIEEISRGEKLSFGGSRYRDSCRHGVHSIAPPARLGKPSRFIATRNYSASCPGPHEPV